MSHLTKKIIKKSDQIKYKKLEIYCLCKNNKKKGSMVLCRKESDCISFKERLKIENAIGGNWFHFKCVNVKKSPKGSWYCPKFKEKEKPKNPKIVLKHLVARENRKIYKISGDGNCLFSSFALLLKGTIKTPRDEIRYLQ